jgi:hypothetical protein
MRLLYLALVPSPEEREAGIYFLMNFCANKPALKSIIKNV